MFLYHTEICFYCSLQNKPWPFWPCVHTFTKHCKSFPFKSLVKTTDTPLKSKKRAYLLRGLFSSAHQIGANICPRLRNATYQSRLVLQQMFPVICVAFSGADRGKQSPVPEVRLISVQERFIFLWGNAADCSITSHAALREAGEAIVCIWRRGDRLLHLFPPSSFSSSCVHLTRWQLLKPSAAGRVSGWGFEVEALPNSWPSWVWARGHGDHTLMYKQVQRLLLRLKQYKTLFWSMLYLLVLHWIIKHSEV